MASTSESSSAVLELNDADYEECPGEADDHSLTPLIMEHGHDIAVKVDAPIKQLSTMETFVTYRVRCACARWQNIPPYVRRRYNHFKALYKRLAAAYPLFAVPPLPPLHSARQQLDRYSPSFVAIRTLALNAYLDSIAKHPILTHSEDFRLFCTTPDEEFDKVFKSENSALNLWGLSSALYGSSDPKPTTEPRVRDPEWSCACDYLNSLQQRLTTLCALTVKLYKHSTALGNQYFNMRTSCAGLGRGGQGVGRGAGRAGGAWRGAGGGAWPRAKLPLLAAHAAAHADKIKQRHLAPASAGGVPAAEEALRAELSNWTPRARAEVKAVLTHIADRQVHTLTQILYGWEHALKISTDADIGELFKTVSKTAVQNLSPTKYKGETPSVTENNIEDLETYTDSDSLEKLVHDEEKETSQSYFDVFDKSSEGSDVIRPNCDGNGESGGNYGEDRDNNRQVVDRHGENSGNNGENYGRIGENDGRIGEGAGRIGEISGRNGESAGNSGESYSRFGEGSKGDNVDNCEKDDGRSGEGYSRNGEADGNNGEVSGNNGEDSGRNGEHSNVSGEDSHKNQQESASNKQDSDNNCQNEQNTKEMDEIMDPLRGFSDVDISS